MKPTVLIADDHPLMAEGLSVLLAPDFQLLGWEANGPAIVEKVQLFHPDVVIMDISMPRGSGLDAAKKIHLHQKDVRIVILTQHTEWAYVQAAFAAGASGYVVKNAAASELRTAIRQALKGKLYISPLLKPREYLHGKTGSHAGNFSAKGLTGRQLEVLKLIASGMTAKEMAAFLNISVKTIEFHRSMIAEKLQLRTIAELTIFAYQMGLVS